MPHEVYEDVRSVLGMQRDTTITISVDTDRPNIRYSHRTLQFNQDQYNDLNFLIPSNISSTNDIPLTLVYFDDVKSVEAATEHLWT